MVRLWEYGKRSECSMGKDMVLPKNIRQIGDIRGEERIYMEDYVMTYIRKKEQQEEQGNVGILLGERHETQEGLFVFIRGIVEVPRERTENSSDTKEQIKRAQQKEVQQKEESGENASDTGTIKEDQKETDKKTDGERKQEEKTDKEAVVSLKEQIHRARIEYFPGWDVQGCCVIGRYRPEELEKLAQILPETQQIIYHLQEQEETLYRKLCGEYRRVGGYFVFYEQNRKMQEYLSDIFRDATVEKESRPETAMKSFREKIREKGEQKKGSVLKLASSFFVVTVLVIGAIVVNRMEEIRSVGNMTGTDGTISQEQWDLIYNRERMLAEQQAGDAGRNVETESSGNAIQEEGEEQEALPTGTAAVQENAGLEGSDAFWGRDEATGDAGQNAAIEETGSAGQNAAVEEAGGAGQNAAVEEAGGAGQSAVLEEAGGAGQNAAVEEAGGAEQNTVLEEAGGAEQNTVSEGTDSAGQNAVSEGTDSAGQGAVPEETGEAGQSAVQEGTDRMGQGTQPADSSNVTGMEAAQEASARSMQASYVIRPGDTLAGISQQYYGNILRVAEICEANGISDANTIMPGQKIVLP